MPIQVVADESGTKGTDPVFVVGGLIGEAEDWLAFAAEWEACLAETPTVPYFKMRDADKLLGGFAMLDAPKRDAKLGKLADILSSFDFTSLHVTIDIPAFVAVVHRRSRSRQQPYQLAFTAFIASACSDLYERGHSERFEMIFDDNPKQQQRAKRLYPHAFKIMPSRWRNIAPIDPLFRDDKDFLPLQAADLVAWLRRREFSQEPHNFYWLHERIKVRESPESFHYDTAMIERIMALPDAPRHEP